VARAHGVRGHVVVELTTDREERVAPGAVLIGPDGPLEVRSSRAVPGSGWGSRWIVRFAGVDGRTAAEALRGAVLRAAPIHDPEALWVHELVGAEVVDLGGAALGRVTDLQANPASDLLVLDTGLLVPLRFLVRTEPAEGRAERVVVDAPPGLADL
jgi:16S rRNA processing protein RimM